MDLLLNALEIIPHQEQNNSNMSQLETLQQKPWFLRTLNYKRFTVNESTKPRSRIHREALDQVCGTAESGIRSPAPLPCGETAGNESNGFGIRSEFWF